MNSVEHYIFFIVVVLIKWCEVCKFHIFEIPDSLTLISWLCTLCWIEKYLYRPKPYASIRYGIQVIGI